MSTIYNPSGKTYFYGTTGSAITAQPTVKMTSKALGSSISGGAGGGVTNVAHGKNMKWWEEVNYNGNRIYPSKRTAIMGATLDTAITGATVAASSGFAKYTKASHGLSVNDVIFVTDTNSVVDGIQRVTSIDGNDFTTDMPYVSGAGTLTIKKATGTIALNSAGRYVMYQYSTTINGVASTALRSPAPKYAFERSIKKFESAGRNPKTATAIRAGYWNIYTGTWSTAPTASNDSIGDVAGSTVTDGSADHAANMSRTTPGELVYLDGSKPPETVDYDAKTG